MNEAVHAHGALAGIELVHTGHRDGCLYSREVPIAVGHVPVSTGYPAQARAMDRADIRNYRRWHRDAALRANTAAAFELFVRGFGLSDAPAQRLIDQVAAWDAAGRPATARLHLRAYPLESGYVPSPAEVVIPKRWSQLVLSWD